MLHRRSRHMFAGATAAVVVGAVLFGAASPAFAASDDLWTQNVRWQSVSSDEPYIGDAATAYADLLGSGVTLPGGWTDDAFDGVLQDWRVSDGGTEDDITWVGVSSSVDAAGVSTWTYTGTSVNFPAATFEATLSIEGSTARWEITPSAGVADLVVSAWGELGSDGDETVTVVTPNSAVVSSDDEGRDPVIGFWFDAPGGVWEQASGDGAFTLSFDGTGAATLVVALQDYAPCAEQDAVAEMTALVPTLGAQFGLTIDGALDCITVATPTELTVGAASTQSLTFTLDPAVDEFLPELYLESEVYTYLGDPSVLGTAVVGLPDGVTATVDAATAQLVLSGTPTVAGTYDVTVILYRTDAPDPSAEAFGNGIPLVGHVTLTVAGKTLTATGAPIDDAPIGLAAGFLVLGSLVLAGAAATRRRA